MELQGIGFKYKSNNVLTNISLSIPSGQIIGLIGENGSGKTTLLKLMAGILTPTSGTITFNKQKVTRQSAKFTAYQPDIDLFYESFTGDMVFNFHNEQFGDFDLSLAHEIAAFLQVPTTTKLKKLSKGNRARIKMATVLARDASLYLLDEPFSGLDPLARESLIKALIRFVDIEKSSIILSTHEVNEAEQILDSVILLKDGQIHAMENVETIRDEQGISAVSWMANLYRNEGKK